MPSYGEIAQIITALAAAGALINSFRNGKKINEVHVATNSRLTELLELTRSASKAEGVKEEKERIK